MIIAVVHFRFNSFPIVLLFVCTSTRCSSTLFLSHSHSFTQSNVITSTLFFSASISFFFVTIDFLSFYCTLFFHDIKLISLLLSFFFHSFSRILTHFLFLSLSHSRTPNIFFCSHSLHTKVIVETAHWWFLSIKRVCK